MGVLKSVEPTGFLAFAPAFCGNKLGGCVSADHPKLPALPRTSFVFACLFGSGFAGLGKAVRVQPPGDRHVRSGSAVVSAVAPHFVEKIGRHSQAALPHPNMLLRHAGPVALPRRSIPRFPNRSSVRVPVASNSRNPVLAVV